MKKNALLAFIVLLLSACTVNKNESSETAVGVKSLDPQEFKTTLAATTDAVLVDVRTPAEFNEGKLAGAINVDYKDQEFTKNIGTLERDKPYFVYCLSGKRSNDAAQQMKALGFTTVYVLEDGLQDAKGVLEVEQR